MNSSLHDLVKAAKEMVDAIDRLDEVYMPVIDEFGQETGEHAVHFYDRTIGRGGKSEAAGDVTGPGKRLREALLRYDLIGR